MKMAKENQESFKIELNFGDEIEYINWYPPPLEGKWQKHIFPHSKKKLE